MTTVDWVYYYTTEAMNWLEPVVYVVGLIIAIWAFRQCSKRGYIVLAFYFALCLFSLLAMPHINRAIRARRAPDISEQTRQKMDEAVRQAMDRVYEEPDIPSWQIPATSTFRSVTFCLSQDCGWWRDVSVGRRPNDPEWSKHSSAAETQTSV